MVTISAYKTSSSLLIKSFCKLAEKCYYGNLITTVITQSSDDSIAIDRALWTYSKQHFIPHATVLDHINHEPPIYITHDVSKIINCTTLILVNTTRDTLLEVIGDSTSKIISKVNRIIFIFDDTNTFQLNHIKNIIDKSVIDKYSIKYFTQDSKLHWVQNTNA